MCGGGHPNIDQDHNKHVILEEKKSCAGGKILKSWSDLEFLQIHIFPLKKNSLKSCYEANSCFIKSEVSFRLFLYLLKII